MSFSLVAWAESQDTAGVLTEMSAVKDQHITTKGDDVLVPSFAPNLMALFALGTTISRAQFSTPSLRERSLIDISPLNIGAEPLSNPRIVDYVAKPIALTPGEGARFLVAEGAAGAELGVGLAWLQGEAEAAPDGEIETIRCSSTTTLTANTWTLCELTLSQQLRAGTYAIVGMAAISAGAIAARLVIPGSAYRPGVIAFDAESDFGTTYGRNGKLGSWGTFEHVYPPQIEFLSISADTAETVYLDIVKVA
ncbi:MAG: hypothetical protein PHQ41_04050 [Candidatus Cloacimonetes bacterium]|nr:hypothetical protein [Candidatus Cloacimonadota bacterium]